MKTKIIILVCSILLSCNSKQKTTECDIHWHLRYKTDKNQKREWTREIFFSDLDSITVSKWPTMSKEEKVKAVEEAFIFHMDSADWAEWNNYSTEVK